jgi:hypothetical protein
LAGRTKVTFLLEQIRNPLTPHMRRKSSPRWRGSLKGMVRFMTAGDAVVLGLVVFSALVLLVVLPGRVLSGGTLVEIRSADGLVGQFALNGDRTVEVPGPLGTTVVQIRGGRARIASSPCPKGICRHMTDIGSEGGMVACVPNQVVVRVSGEREDGLDGVTR